MKTPRPLEDLIQHTCEAIRQLPATDSSLEEMIKRGIERGKYDATLPIRVELDRVLDFLEPFERGVESFSTMPQALSNSLATELQAVKQIADGIPINCQLQTTNVVPPSFHGGEAGVAKRVDTIHARIYSQLISFRAQLKRESEAPRSPATPDFEVKPQESTSEPAPIAKRGVVITLHGIRTRAKWQKAFDEELSRSGFISVSPDYGWFSVLPFLFQGQRDRKVSWFIEEYQKIIARSPAVVPSVVAHSLGTYIVARAITESAGQVKFDKIIFCGSIVPVGFPWSSIIEAGLASEVLNDCAYLDLWAGTAGLALPDAGPSGQKGFQDLANGKVHQRVHSAWRHSQFFFSLNYQGRWIPFLKGQPVTDLDFKRNRHFPVLWLLATLLLISALLGAGSYVHRNWKKATEPPKVDEAAVQEELRPEPEPELHRQEPKPRRQEPLKVNQTLLKQCTPDTVHIVVSLSKQRAYLMRNEQVVIDAPISSGKDNRTAKGHFKILEKDANHRSSLYGDYVDSQGRIVPPGESPLSTSVGIHFVGIPMKWYLRFEDGGGMYADILLGYPASYGTIRVSLEAAKLFFDHTEVGTHVDIADDF